MPGKTGHILRHTHRTFAQRIGTSAINARLLLDHKLPGIDDHYVHSHGMFEALLKDQQAISDEMDRYLFPDSAPMRFKVISGGMN
jgi:integrase